MTRALVGFIFLFTCNSALANSTYLKCKNGDLEYNVYIDDHVIKLLDPNGDEYAIGHMTYATAESNIKTINYENFNFRQGLSPFSSIRTITIKTEYIRGRASAYTVEVFRPNRPPSFPQCREISATRKLAA